MLRTKRSAQPVRLTFEKHLAKKESREEISGCGSHGRDVEFADRRRVEQVAMISQ